MRSIIIYNFINSKFLIAQSHFRSLTDGAKELRLNRVKRTTFYDAVLQQSIEKVRKERTLGMSVFVASTGWGNFLIYAFIGMVLFILAGDVPDRTSIMTGLRWFSYICWDLSRRYY